MKSAASVGRACRPRLSARVERPGVDLKALGDASPEALVAGEFVETGVVETRGLALHHD